MTCDQDARDLDRWRCMRFRWDRNAWTVGATLAFFVAGAGAGLGSVGGAEAAIFEPEITEGCSNLDGHVVHDGVWWSANGALVQLNEVPERWLTSETVPGGIIVEGDTARFFPHDGPVLELRRFSELHCAIGS